jgi:non-canonical (house-cleaning) NTP pyrophosphatase
VRHLILGSKSPIKLDAVCEALRCTEITGRVDEYPVPSGVNEQPVGYEEGLQGAKNRVHGARSLHPHADLWIGIESTILRGPPTLDIVLILILLPTGEEIVGCSPGLHLPEEYVIEAERRGFDKCAVSQVIAEKLDGDHKDPHATLTKGDMRRKRAIAHGLINVFRQIPPKFLYN